MTHCGQRILWKTRNFKSFQNKFNQNTGIFQKMLNIVYLCFKAFLLLSGKMFYLNMHRSIGCVCVVDLKGAETSKLFHWQKKNNDRWQNAAEAKYDRHKLAEVKLWFDFMVIFCFLQRRNKEPSVESLTVSAASLRFWLWYTRCILFFFMSIVCNGYSGCSMWLALLSLWVNQAQAHVSSRHDARLGY